MPVTTLFPHSVSETTETWQKQLAEAVHDTDELLTLLELKHTESITSDTTFRLKVPKTFISKMEKGNPGDPLLKQVLPLSQENQTSGLLDPVGDLDATVSPGVIHKYNGRVLLITTGACAVHCRYCFRRNFPYSDEQLRSGKLSLALDYIASNSSLFEVILSGGDPLTLSDTRLAELYHELEKIPHIKWIRIHTRVPVMLPSRITDQLLSIISTSSLKTTMVLHINHPNEITQDDSFYMSALRENQVTLLNQSVLLKGINDNAETLTKLSHSLFDNDVLPYYLHMLDPAKGTGHFAVSEQTAVELIKALSGSLPGYLVPALVREEKGTASKTAIFSI